MPGGDRSDDDLARAVVAAGLAGPAANEPAGGPTVVSVSVRDGARDPVELPVPSLGRTWWVVVDGAPERRVRDRLPRAVQDLQEHELDDYHPGLDWWLKEMPTLSGALARLGELHVIHAVAAPVGRVPSAVLVSEAADLPPAGVDAALDVLDQGLRTAAASADSTDGGRAVVVVADAPAPTGYVPRRRRGEPAPPTTPAEAPTLPDGTDEAWLVHRATGHAWHWDGATWSASRQG
jgi:hypothetical protein